MAKKITSKKKTETKKVTENFGSFGLNNFFKSKKNQWLGGILVVLIIGVVLFQKFGVVARVNGVPIYRLEYVNQLQKNDTTVLDQMIQEALIFDEAEKNGVEISQDEIDAEIEDTRSQVEDYYGMTLEEALEAEGMTEEDLITQIKIQLLAEKMAEEASPAAEISQEDIDEFLTENVDYLEDMTDAEKTELAKEQLESQAKNSSLSDWYNNLMDEAEIIYN